MAQGPSGRKTDRGYRLGFLQILEEEFGEMEGKINKVRRDLRALKKSSHALQRIIATQGIHFARVKALESMEKSEERDRLIEKERELISSLELEKHLRESAQIEEKYLSALNKLPVQDKAMMLDGFVAGLPYWKIAVEYGYSEEGVRKHIRGIMEKVALGKL